MVCYENAALSTFQVARALGVKTVLDAASVHHVWQDRWAEFRESPHAHKRITARKDAELALADHVITASELARESYVKTGLARENVTTVPLGVDLDRFTPGPPADRDDGVGDTCQFVFAGQTTRLRVSTRSVESSALLLGRGAVFKLSVAGGSRPSFASTLPADIEFRGRLTQSELAALFRGADCVLLPSRFDSFGMVVLEAMACGAPVIVSDRVGAGSAVRWGENGWIIPAEDSLALAGRMEWCIRHLPSLRGMRPAAREVALKYSWTVYRQRVRALLTNLMGS